jgi:hypothetical protein
MLLLGSWPLFRPKVIWLRIPDDDLDCLKNY